MAVIRLLVVSHSGRLRNATRSLTYPLLLILH
jgi:hypothetical protein